MRTLYSKFTTKSFRYLSALFFLLGDIIITSYLYLSTKSQLKELMKNPLFEELFQKSMKEQGLELPPDITNDIFQIFTQSMLLFILLVIIFHIIIYLFYLNEKRFSYLYLRLVSGAGLLTGLYLTILKVGDEPLVSLLFFGSFLLYLFNFAGFFFYPIPNKTIES